MNLRKNERMILPLLVLIPISWGIVAYALPTKWRWIAGVGNAISMPWAVVALLNDLSAREARRHVVGGWPSPLGITLVADGLSATMLVLTTAVGVPISLFAVTYLQRKTGLSLFWPLWLLLWSGLNAVFLSGDLFNIYVGLEVIGLSAVALAALSAEAKALIASMRYLLAAMVGSLAYLMGVALLYAEQGTLDLYQAGAQLGPTTTSTAACALMMTGLFLKTALFPLHFWLPPAHGAAISPVSAILSGLVVKASFYVALRLWVSTFGSVAGFAAAQMIGVMGAAAILWGSFQAVRQRKLKPLVAHSTVSQIGYLFLLFPLISAPLGNGSSVDWLQGAWSGGIYQVIAHALAKSALFLAAGIILLAIGDDHLVNLGDVAARMPLTTFAIALSGVSLIGLPPTGGFVSKWLILKAVIGSGQWWWAPVIVLGGLLTAGYVFNLLRYTFKPRTADLPELRRVPWSLELNAFALALGALIAGIFAQYPLDLLQVGTPFAHKLLQEEVMMQ